MNTYLCFGRSGKSYLVKASYSHTACAKVEDKFNDKVSCWFMGEPAPKNCIVVD